jgi:hypothetical protein
MNSFSKAMKKRGDQAVNELRESKKKAAAKKTKQIQTKQLEKNKKDKPKQYASSDSSDTDSSSSKQSNSLSPPYEYNPEYDEIRCDDETAPGTSHYKSIWSDNSSDTPPKKDIKKKVSEHKFY